MVRRDLLLHSERFLVGKKVCSSAGRPVHYAGSELVVLVFEQDVERGERAVTARDIRRFLISDF